jgi:hypothetical protein
MMEKNKVPYEQIKIGDWLIFTGTNSNQIIHRCIITDKDHIFLSYKCVKCNSLCSSLKNSNNYCYRQTLYQDNYIIPSSELASILYGESL